MRHSPLPHAALVPAPGAGVRNEDIGGEGHTAHAPSCALRLLVLGVLVIAGIGCDGSVGDLEPIPDARTLLRRQPGVPANRAVVRASGERGERTGGAVFYTSRSQLPGRTIYHVILGLGGAGADGSARPAERSIGSVDLYVPDSLIGTFPRRGAPVQVYGWLQYDPADGVSRARGSAGEPGTFVLRRVDSLHVEAAFAGLVRDPPPDMCFLFSLCEPRRLQYVEGRFHAVLRAPAH